MNAHEVHVMSLSKTAKDHRAALANQECRSELSKRNVQCNKLLESSMADSGLAREWKLELLDT